MLFYSEIVILVSMATKAFVEAEEANHLAEISAEEAAISTFGAALSSQNNANVWFHQFHTDENLDVLVREENLLALMKKQYVRTALLFNLRDKYFLAHVCPVKSKHKCLCFHLTPYLVINRTQRVNNNYFQRTKLDPLLFIVACMHYNISAITNGFVLINDKIFDYRMLFPLSNGLRTKFKIPTASIGDDKRKFSPFLEKKFKTVMDFAECEDTQQARSNNFTGCSLQVVSDERVDELLLSDDPILDKKEQAYLESLQDPVSDFIVTLMWRYLPIPLGSLSIVPDESRYKYMSEKDPSFQRAIERFTRDFCAMPIVDFFAFLKDRTHRTAFQVASEYHTLEDSKRMIKEWFVFQFGEDWKSVLQEFYAVVSGARLKKRSIWFVGPPNSGKTYILKSLASCFVLVGHIKNLIAKGQFPFQDILNKRILFLDELTIPNEFLDDFEDIFGAQDLLINKKKSHGI